MIDSWITSPDRRLPAVLIGATVGFLAGLLALLVVLIGPPMAFAAVFGLGVGLYVLTNLEGALVVTIAVIALIPFGNLPVQFSLTPTLLDCAIGGFLVVYAFQWMTGDRRLFRMTPLAPVIVLFTAILLFTFIMGLRHAPLTPRVLRNIVETVMGLVLIPILVDVLRDEDSLRRATRMMIGFGAVSALVGIGLWWLPDFTAESLLNRLGRIGYPMGGVIRYRTTYGSVLNERAIGTWIDPNAFGGYLLMMGAITAPQVFAQRPVMRRGWIVAALGLIVLALFLSDSRGSMLSLGAAFVFIAALRYRKLLLIMAVAVVLSLYLPFTQRYIAKLEAGFSNQDVETQMRFGEYKDAFILIGRHPVVGVGFSGTPEIDLYLGVANTYLTIASSMGLVGLAAYLLLMLSPFATSAYHYRHIQNSPALTDIWLGLSAALVGVLSGGVFDHFYFKIDLFQATMTNVWIIMGLLLATVRLSCQQSGGKTSSTTGASPV